MKKLPITRNWNCLYTSLVTLFRSSPEKENSAYNTGLVLKPFYPEQMPADQLLIITSTVSPEKPVPSLGEMNERNQHAGILRSIVFFNWKDLA